MNALRRVANQVFFTRGGQATIATTGATLLASFNFQAETKDFFQASFKTTKDPDAIVDFYSTEDFLQILGVFSFATHAILAGVEWDAKEEMTNTVWNTMRISFDITEKEENINGQDVVTYFNKRERFIQYIPFTKILLWDQVQNYGYRVMPDGQIMVNHEGESFYGPWPVRMLVGLHARYVIWATEKHINSPLFGTEDLEAAEHQRSNIPAYVAQQWLDSLRQSQEDAIAKSKLAGKNSEHQEATLKSIKRLQRRKTTIMVERTPGQPGVLTDSVRVRMEDDDAQKAVRDVLRNVKEVEGSAASANLLSNLLEKTKMPLTVEPPASTPVPVVMPTADAQAPPPKAGGNGIISRLFRSAPPAPPMAAVAVANTTASPNSIGNADALAGGAYGYDSTPKKYGGAYAAPVTKAGHEARTDYTIEMNGVVPKRIQSFPSQQGVDELKAWRTEARSLRLLELLDEAKTPMDERPEEHAVRVPDGIVFKEVIEKASHRHCVEMWDAYTKCKENRAKKFGKENTHDKCKGWWSKYQDCLDDASPKLVLSMLEAVAKDDPDPNMVRLRR